MAHWDVCVLFVGGLEEGGGGRGEGGRDARNPPPLHTHTHTHPVSLAQPLRTPTEPPPYRTEPPIVGTPPPALGPPPPPTLTQVLLLEASTTDPGDRLEVNGDCGLKLSTFAAAPPGTGPAEAAAAGEAAFTSGPFSFARLPEVLARARQGEASVAVTGAALTRIVKHGAAALHGPVEPVIRDLCLTVRVDRGGGGGGAMAVGRGRGVCG
jgi:hypothetical protein